MKKIFLIVACTLAMTSSAQNSANNSAIETKDPRPNPDKISILWDTSLKLNSRSIDKELQLLKLYVENIGSVSVSVSKFSNTIYESKNFSCNSGCEELFTYLKTSEYNGASNFSGLLDKNSEKADVVLVFTNGISVFEPLESRLEIPVFTVNSKKEAEHALLQEVAAASEGSYIDLTARTPQDALEYLLNKIEDDSYTPPVKEGTAAMYYGVVHSDGNPIQGAVVRIKNSFNEVQTESNGRYKIAAQAGDILEISALGMVTKDTLLTDTKKTHIPLVADGELLDEVLLQKKRKAEETVETPFGNQKREAVGYSLGQKFTSADIQPYHTSLRQILVRMPGVIIEGNEGIDEKYVFRKTANASFQNSGKTYPAIVLDGLLIDQQTQRVPFIDPNTIESITLLKSALSTVRFGQLAAYGAIVIETKDYDPGEVVKRENTALVKGNEYDETVTTLEQATSNLGKSNYLVTLEKSSSFEEAKALYYKQLKYEKNNIDYYLTVAPYFERWNQGFASDILSNIAAVAPRNVKALKVLAFQYEKNKELEKARYIYEQLINVQPQDLQSYRDLALIYTQTGEYDLAATLYRQMIYNTIPNVDFAPVQDIVINEFRHLIKNHKSKINYEGLPNELLSLDFKKDIRIVLEWNHPAMEFDIQIVNPEKKYFSFSHTAFNNKELLQNEIDEGFFMKEFIIDDGEKGSWMVNIRYLGQHNDNVPLILKYTMFKNYGTPKETKVMKTLQLDKYQDKITLDNFIN
ncbi:MAG: TonB-dependent receptor plug domain-containing protein [Bacteroidota bacterium]